jgi:hypothetical protein
VVVLRATQKVLRFLPRTARDTDVSDTALGDWYVNRIVIDHQPLLLLVSSKSRLSILTPARDVKALPQRLAEIIGDRLRRLPVDRRLVAAELNAMNAVTVGKTLDRSITGQLVDFAKMLSLYLPTNGWDMRTLRAAEDRLAEAPCLASHPFDEVVFPHRSAIRLLELASRSGSRDH